MWLCEQCNIALPSGPTFKLGLGQEDSTLPPTACSGACYLVDTKCPKKNSFSPAQVWGSGRHTHPGYRVQREMSLSLVSVWFQLFWKKKQKTRPHNKKQTGWTNLSCNPSTTFWRAAGVWWARDDLQTFCLLKQAFFSHSWWHLNRLMSKFCFFLLFWQ